MNSSWHKILHRVKSFGTEVFGSRVQVPPTRIELNSESIAFAQLSKFSPLLVRMQGSFPLSLVEAKMDIFFHFLLQKASNQFNLSKVDGIEKRAGMFFISRPVSTFYALLLLECVSWQSGTFGWRNPDTLNQIFMQIESWFLNCELSSLSIGTPRSATYDWQSLYNQIAVHWEICFRKLNSFF